MLDSHPAVVCYSELLLQGGQGVPTYGGSKDVPFWETYVATARSSTSLGHELLYRYLDTAVFRPRRGIVAIGLKLMYGQAGSHPEFLDYVVDRGVRVVHLVRRNLLDIIVSKEVAVARDVFHAREGEAVPPVRVRLNTGELKRRLSEDAERIDRERARYRALGVPYTEVVYEELAADPSRFDEVLGFLEVPSGPPLTSTLRRLNSAPHHELIENYDEVADTLRDTRFASLLAG